MVRPETQLDSSDRSEAVESVIEGQNIREVSEELTKRDLKNLAEDYEGLEDDLLESGVNYLEEIGVSIPEEEISVNVVCGPEDIDHIDRGLKTDEGGAYIPEESEVVVFTDKSPGTFSMGSRAADPIGIVAHELKHHDQAVKRDNGFGELYPVSEALTQLLNLYREDYLDSYSEAKRKARSLEDSQYGDAEKLVEETELAVESYHNLIESGKSSKEAISFMFNEYEDRRIDYEV